MFLFKKFAKSESAATLLPMAISFFIVIGAVGIAVDMARIQAVKTALQNAVDIALIAGVSTTETLPFEVEARKIFDANFPDGYLGSRVISVTFREQRTRFQSIDDSTGDVGGGHAGGGSIVRGGTFPTGQYFAEARVEIDYKVMQMILGSDHTVVSATAGVKNNLDEQDIKAEIALVLDITGSMAGQKLIDLKTATHLIVERLFGGEESIENLYISIVPYNLAVVLDTTEFPQAINWVQAFWQPRADLQKAVTNRVFLANRNLDNLDNSASGYVDADSSKPISELTRFRTPANPISGQPTIPYNPLLPFASGPTCRKSGDIESLGNMAPMIFASNTQTPLHTRVDELQIGGCTRVNVGAMWGWFALSPNWQGVWDAGKPDLPLTQANNVSKIMVLLTDGNNTVYLAQGPNVSHDDTSLRNVCAAAKATGITIYTVTLGSSVDAALMQECATDPAHYFHAPNSSQLAAVFDAIASHIMSEWLILNK